MQVEDFLLLDATVARSNKSDSEEDIGELSEICCIITHLYSTLEDDLELIQDDEMLGDASDSSWRNRPLIAEDDSAEDLKKIAADINTHHARSRAQARPSDDNDDSIWQLDAVMYCFSMPVNVASNQLEYECLLEHCYRITELSS